MDEAAMSIRIFIKYKKFSLQVFRIGAANAYGLIFWKNVLAKIAKKRINIIFLSRHNASSTKLNREICGNQ